MSVVSDKSQSEVDAQDAKPKEGHPEPDENDRLERDGRKEGLAAPIGLACRKTLRQTFPTENPHGNPPLREEEEEAEYAAHRGDNSLNDRVAGRDRLMTISAFSAEENPAEYRNVVVKADGMSAFRTERCRANQTLPGR